MARTSPRVVWRANAQSEPRVKRNSPEDPTFSVPSSFTALSTMLRTASSTWCNRRANKSARVVASLIENVTLRRKEKGSIYIPRIWMVPFTSWPEGWIRAKYTQVSCWAHLWFWKLRTIKGIAFELPVTKASPARSGSEVQATFTLHHFLCSIAFPCQLASYLLFPQNPFFKENRYVHLL